MPISHHKVPNGGWKFYEKKTNITLHAATWQELRFHLERHRKSNGIDVGDVERDLDEQISKEHPELVTP